MDLLTLDEAAAQLGWTGKRKSPNGSTPRARRLRRIIEAAEAVRKRPIMLRSVRKGRTELRVNMSALRAACPSLFPSKVDDLERDFKRYIGRLDARIDARVAEYVEPRYLELYDRDEKIAGIVQQLQRDLAKLSPRGGRCPGGSSAASSEDRETH